MSEFNADELRPITLIEAIPGQLSVANRKLDTSNPLDAAILEFLFKFNLKADGLTADEIELLWRQSPWSKEAVEGFEKYYEDDLGNPVILNPKG